MKASLTTGGIFARDITLFQDKIDYFLSSVDCGFRKPNKKGLEMIADRYQINLANIAFVGEEKDIKTAKNAGAISFLINRNKKNISYGEDIQITSLTEIKGFL